MTPKARPGGNRRYTVKWKPLESGGKVELGSNTGFPVLLAAPSGATLPWNRLGKQRKPIDAIHTHLAIPQMIGSGKVQPFIQEDIERRIDAKLSKYIDQPGQLQENLE